ncbi:MAG: hypothetical protein ABH832_04710 [bacterium]
MSEIKRKKNESFEAFLRRVKKRWMQSGKVLQAKKIRFFAPKESKNTRKKSALHRRQVGAKIEYLKKIGKMPEDNKGYR